MARHLNHRPQIMPAMIAAMIALTGLMTPHSAAAAPAGDSLHQVSSKDSVSKRLKANRGGSVSGPDGVTILVPPHVMKRDGRVRVMEVFPNVYDVHIFPRWKGRVEVRLPLSNGLPVVAHKRAGAWSLEDAVVRDGMAATRVRHLSLFSAIKACPAKLIGIGLPSRRVLMMVLCFIEHGVKDVVLPSVIRKAVNAILGEAPWDPCNPKITWSSWKLDELKVILTPCVLQADPVPAGSSQPPPAAGGQPPAAGGAPPAPSSPGVALVGDAYVDGKVDCNDIQTVKANWGRSGAAAGTADVNHDGTVNIVDISVVVAHWTSSQTECPT